MPRYTEQELRAVVPHAKSMTEVVRHFGLRPAGGNHKLLRRWLAEWGISTEHFVGTPPPQRREPIPLEDVLVPGSTYNRHQLKQRLYDRGLKQRRCEMCGQGEEWQGRRMSLILDHINGIADDDRIENLRIVWRVQRRRAVRALRQGKSPHRQRYCSRECGIRWARAGLPRPGARRVERPPYEELVAEVEATGWSAVGRKYGVSDNAVRKWVRAYQRERAAGGLAAAGVD